MEGTFINFALEGSSAASTVPRRKSALNPRDSTRAYPGLPTPETPSNTVETEVENEMDHADGWDTTHDMYAGQQTFGDVSILYIFNFALNFAHPALAV
jgi:hypothetical protein